MNGPIVLRGSSWDHPRGQAPMLATASEYERNSGGTVQIEWTPRSLKAFGSASIDDLARDYDLILVDHPHIGSTGRSRAVLPLDEFLEASALDQLAQRSPGRSHQSYAYGGHQWALAVDAACQVAAWRPDLITDSPRTWPEVFELASSGRVLWPLCEVDAVASFFSLAALNGGPCGTVRDVVVDRAVGLGALQTMRRVAQQSDRRCLRMNPIDVLEAMSRSDTFVYSPLLFGYVNYSRLDTHGAQIVFGNVPIALEGPAGALLGGVGIAVSASSRVEG